MRLLAATWPTMLISYRRPFPGDNSSVWPLPAPWRTIRLLWSLTNQLAIFIRLQRDQTFKLFKGLVVKGKTILMVAHDGSGPTG